MSPCGRRAGGRVAKGSLLSSVFVVGDAVGARMGWDGLMKWVAVAVAIVEGRDIARRECDNTVCAVGGRARVV